LSYDYYKVGVWHFYEFGVSLAVDMASISTRKNIKPHEIIVEVL